MRSKDILRDLIEENGWLDIPARIISREGNVIDTSTENWKIDITSELVRLRFDRVQNPLLRWALKRRVIHSTRTLSSHSGVSVFNDVCREALARQQDFGLTADIPIKDIQERLVSLMEAAILKAREGHRLWALYRTIRWYVWCADNFPEIGFDTQYANELDGMSIPGNPKGEAVKSEDPDAGPLDRTLEMPLLITALERDGSMEYAHLQEKAAVALSIAFGRNPANLVWLNCTDMVNLTEGADPQKVPPLYVLKIPRIKKRQLNPRNDFIEEKMDAALAKHILNLIHANQNIDTSIMTDQGRVTVSDKPLFIRRHRLPAETPIARIGRVFRVDASRISTLLRDFVERHNVISPISNEPLYLTTRRLRYTLACGLVEEGISRRQLAKILDHSDTQHVEVYFALKGRLVRFLDEAVAKQFGGWLAYFTGRIVTSDAEAVNGDREDKHLSFVSDIDPHDNTEIGVCGESDLCRLDPPYSCYLCAKFQPYADAAHDHVLQILLTRREGRRAKGEHRLAVQLDQVIFAVGQVVESCRQVKEVTHG